MIKAKTTKWKSHYKNDFYQHPIFKYFMQAKLNAVLKRIPRRPELAVDLGCGFGYLLVSLAECAKFVVGIDQNTSLKKDETKPFARPRDWEKNVESIFEVTRSLLESELSNWKQKVELREAYTWNTGLEDQSVDVVCALDVFEHVGLEFREQSKKEMVRVLRPGGRLVYTVPNTIGIAWWIRKTVAFILGRKEDPDTKDHKNYDWKKDLLQWQRHLLLVEVKHFPGYWLGLEPSIIVVLEKKP